MMRRRGLRLRQVRAVATLPVIVAFAVTLAALPGVGVSAPAHWADQALSEGIVHGILQGYPDGSLQPDRPVTRGELCTMIIRMLGEEEAAKTARRLLSSFRDVDENHWAKGYLEVAREKGIFKGDAGDTAAPDRGVTRAEAATMIDRCISSLGVPIGSVSRAEFLDAGDIPSWAQESIGRLAGAGVVVGDVDGRFYPGRSLTRAEAATLTLRVLGLAGRRWSMVGRFRGMSQDNTRLYLEAQGQGVSLPLNIAELEVYGRDGSRAAVSAIGQGSEIGVLLKDGQVRLAALLP